MNRLRNIIIHLMKGLSVAVLRFPFTVLCLVVTASIICYIISLNEVPALTLEKWVFTLVVGALLGMVAQFSLERFEKLSRLIPALYGVALLLTAGYFAILWPAPELSPEIATRTFVAVISMICAVLWIPAFKGKADFNKIALIHFKSFFTSILYSGVMSAGLAAIIFAIDQLLYSVNDDSYSYMMSIVWVIFAPVFYLSLLPKFNPKSLTEEAAAQKTSSYPRFLEILVSYISIPLFTAYTIVLFAYFIKILVSMNWPSGQLGPMVLAYSGIGLIIFVLASLPENRFAILYRKIFPKIWVPIVIMQLVSVWIRLNAYGITESRYYVALFGIFSIVTAVFLSLRPVHNNRIIALLVASFAIFSIIPPVDAFTVSRNSQINRIEAILQSEGILTDGKLIPKDNPSENTKIEVTNILNYLDSHSSLKYISWLPEDFKIYVDMKQTFGFNQFYGSSPGNGYEYFYASLDSQIPLDITGFDISVVLSSNRYMVPKEEETFPFTIRGVNYELTINSLSENEINICVNDAMGNKLISAELHEFTKELHDLVNPMKELVPPDMMTFVVSNNDYSLKIIFQNVSITYGGNQDTETDFTAYVLFKAPDIAE